MVYNPDAASGLREIAAQRGQLRSNGRVKPKVRLCEGIYIFD